MIKILYRITAVAGLLVVFIPAILRYTGTMADGTMKNLMFAGTLIWFIGAIPWLGKKKQPSQP